MISYAVQYTYDNLGRILSKTQSATDGSNAITVMYRYGKNGNLRFATDGNGNVTTAAYDAMNRVLTQTKGEHTTTYTYDANGKVLTTTDWRGNTSTNVFDDLNRLIEQKDAYNHVVQSFAYNNNSVQVTSTDALGHVTTYIYDKNNRLIRTIDPANHSASQTYDNAGQIDSKTDENGNVTNYGYDEFNRLTSVINAANETTAFTYDGNGNVLTLKDGSDHVTTYEYNCANQLIKSIKHGGRTGTTNNYTYDYYKVQSYTYEANGQLSTKKDQNGNITTFTYDIHGRLLSRTTVSSDGSVTVSYTYDSNGNVLTMTDGTGTATRVYDALGRTTSKTVPDMGTSTYVYDQTAGLTTGCTAQTTTDPNGNITKKVYDRVGRISEVIADSMTTVYHYFDNGSLQNVIYSSGAREDYTYTVNNLLSTLVNRKADSTIIDSYSYTYDDARNLLSKVDVLGTTSYSYDSLNRLLTVTEPSGKVTSYTYDAAGNRKTQTVVLGTDTTVTTYTYDSQNHLTGTVAKLNGVTTGTVAYTFDNNGNQLTKTSTAYIAGIAQTPVTDQTNTYDLLNQLISTITSSNVTVTNTYNGDGLRVGKTVIEPSENGPSTVTTTRYLYEYDKVVLEESASGVQTGRNVYGINLITRQVGGDALIYMYNGHADVTALVGTSGEVAATYYYDAFGNILDQTGSISNNILYAGYQYDTETGLYYLNARMYDPVTARFMQEDTYTGEYSDPLSLNLYTYCKNEPIRYSDPSGHRQIEGTEIGGYKQRTTKGLSSPAKAHTEPAPCPTPSPTPKGYQPSNLELFLSPLKFADKSRITSVMTNAKEPYKSAYQQSLKPNMFGSQNFYIADTDYQNTNRFESFGGILPGNIKIDIDASGVFPDSTFFHEWAHAVDNNYLEGSFWFKDSQKLDFQDKIIADVTDNITATAMDSYVEAIMQSDMDTSIKMAQLQDETEKAKAVQTVVGFILDPDNNEKNRNNREGLSPLEAQTANITIDYYEEIFDGSHPENSMASDIYSGVTNNLFDVGYNHGFGINGSYWYNSNGKINGNLASEFFAEGLSTMIAGPDDFINSANQFFPTALPELNSILVSKVSK